MAYENDIFSQWDIPVQPDPVIADGLATANGGTLLGTSGSAINIEATGLNVADQGYIRSGQTNYNTGTGWWIGRTGGISKFSMGTPGSSSITWDGNKLTVLGGIQVSSIDIPDTTTTASFHVDSTGRRWSGATTFAAAPLQEDASGNITSTGTISASNITITGGAISGTPISSIPNNSTTDISLLEFTQNLAFTSASATQINWGAGTINLSNGRTFSISSGNTGAMAALTYIYLDTGASTTVLQHTTTYSTAIGANKILIAAAQNNTTAASVITFGGGQPILDGAAQIAALSITAGAIAASTITAGKLSVSQLSAIAADMGTLTTGVINLSSGTANIHAGQSAYDTGTGFWLEYNSGTPRFSIGNSSGNKITWDGTTLTIVGAENVSKIFTAAESIAANDALYLDGYQSDGGPTLDTSTSNSGTSDGSGNLTITTPITIGSNSNRLLIFCLKCSSATATGVTATWNGTSMTGSRVQIPGGGLQTYLFYLIAPTTGAHNIVLASLTATETVSYTVHSYYNMKQSGQPDASTNGSIANPPGTFVGVSLTPVTNGSLMFAMAVDADRTDGTVTGIPNNNRSSTIGGATLISGDNGPINIINSQTVTMSDGGSGRKLINLFMFAPATTAVPAVRKASSVSTTKSAAFIGFASAIATAGNNVTVITDGTVSGFSGLTFGLQYYLNDTSGTIGTSAGSVTRKVGIAVATTALKITNIW